MKQQQQLLRSAGALLFLLYAVFVRLAAAQRGGSAAAAVPAPSSSFGLAAGAVPDQMEASPGPSGSISFAGDLSSGMTGGSGVWPQRKCVDITVPLCRGIGYNHTYMPNEFHQETQEEIAMEVPHRTAPTPTRPNPRVRSPTVLYWPHTHTHNTREQMNRTELSSTEH